MFIDAHCHVTPLRSVMRTDNSTYTLPEELIEMLDRAGIDKAVLLPMSIPDGNHHIISTEQILEIARRFPDRFIPWCNMDPRQGMNSPKTDFTPLLQYYKEQGCKGVGEATANLYFDDPRVLNLFHHCEKVGLPLLFHIGPQLGECYGLVDDLGLPRLEKALQQFPKLSFIGHSQPFWAEMTADVTNETRWGYPTGKITKPGRVQELLAKYPNMYAEMSAGSGFNALTRDPEYGFKFLEQFQDKLMFGTDICATHNETPLPYYLREQHEKGNISDVVFEKVSWKNSARVMGLDIAG